MLVGHLLEGIAYHADVEQVFTKKTKKMKVYLITRETSEFKYDTYFSFVIIANNPEEVRAIAIKQEPQERDIWLNAKVSEEGEYTGEKKNPFILLDNFKAG